VSVPTPSEHWLDRLAERRGTRRQALKAALAAGAALTLPFMRPGRARAADPHACQTGCNWTAHQHYDSAFNACYVNGSSYFAGYRTWVESAMWGPLVLLGPYAGMYRAYQETMKCADAAMIQQKADQSICQQPGCPGFDPKQKGGPCDTCGASCCPDPSVQGGYSCCTLGCACGGDTGACHSSVDPC